eukprot:6455167-Prymnesium_polylepis.1
MTRDCFGPYEIESHAAFAPLLHLVHWWALGGSSGEAASKLQIPQGEERGRSAGGSPRGGGSAVPPRKRVSAKRRTAASP